MRFLIPPSPLLRTTRVPLFPAAFGRELGMSVRVDLPCGASGGVSLSPAEGFALLTGDLDGAEDLQHYGAIEPFARLHLHCISWIRRQQEKKCKCVLENRGTRRSSMILLQC